MAKDIEYIVIERIEYKDQENIGGRTEQGVWVAHFAKKPIYKLAYGLELDQS